MGKSRSVSTQKMEFLGFQINSVSFHLASHLRKTEETSTGYLQPSETSGGVSEGTSEICGEVKVSVRAIWHALLHYRAMQAMINSVVP